MATINHKISQLSVREFLSEGRYVIPIYQRNYDWGEKETLQLIEDVADYAKEDCNRNYYIGSAIVFIRNNNGQEYFETIDGQQRLTTLTILTSLLKSITLEIQFLVSLTLLRRIWFMSFSRMTLYSTTLYT